MDEKDWTILVILHSEKSVTKAAERLFISQPALSYKINQIENEVNAQIIVRRKKGIEFTPVGEILVDYAWRMNQKLSKLKDNIHNQSDHVRGVIKIGASSNITRYKLPRMLKDFHQNYPEVEFNVQTGWSSNVINMLLSEEVHVAIVRGEHNWAGEKTLLDQESIFIASNDEVELEDLPKIGRINYKTDIFLRHTIEDWWRSKYTKPPLISMEVDRIETGKEMVRMGLGYGIFPSISLQDEEDFYTIQLLDEKDEPILRNTWLLYRKQSLDLSVIRSFIDFVGSYTEDSGKEMLT